MYLRTAVWRWKTGRRFTAVWADVWTVGLRALDGLGRTAGVRNVCVFIVCGGWTRLSYILRYQC